MLRVLSDDQILPYNPLFPYVPLPLGVRLPEGLGRSSLSHLRKVFQKRSMNKPISASGLLKELSIGGIREETLVIPRDATGLGVVGLLKARIERDAKGEDWRIK